MIYHTLTIAGSDSSGGAGIQADLKTFSALGTYGMSVITALTAQNTQGVHAVHAVPAEFITAQCHAVFSDVRVDGVKIGMLADTDIILAVASALRQWRPPCVVLDPVMVAKGGHRLLVDSAVTALRQQLLPLANLVTPNLPEAAVLLDCEEAKTESEMVAQGQALLQLDCQAVLMKGGHLPSKNSPDWLITPHSCTPFSSTRIATQNTHGTGCTLSSAIAALYPQHQDWAKTIQQAKIWLSGALLHADELDVGHSIGPVHHFYQWWNSRKQSEVD